MSVIGGRVRDLRKSEHLTQKDFAKRLLVSQSYLSGIENNNEAPTSKLIKLICHEFGIREEWLTTGQGEMYDAVYENDKGTLADISNSALLKIMQMLSTKSNVQYGHSAYSLAGFADILDCSTLLSEDERLRYLAAIENFTLEFQRAILAFVEGGNTEEGACRQVKEANTALISVFDLLAEIC